MDVCVLSVCRRLNAIHTILISFSYQPFFFLLKFSLSLSLLSFMSIDEFAVCKKKHILNVFDGSTAAVKTLIEKRVIFRWTVINFIFHWAVCVCNTNGSIRNLFFFLMMCHASTLLHFQAHYTMTLNCLFFNSLNFTSKALFIWLTKQVRLFLILFEFNLNLNFPKKK